jgi:hypothetical protein
MAEGRGGGCWQQLCKCSSCVTLVAVVAPAEGARVAACAAWCRTEAGGGTEVVGAGSSSAAAAAVAGVLVVQCEQ